MRILGWLAMVLGVIGIVAGIALASGVWVLKPDIEARAQELVTTADAALERSIALSDRVATRIDDASARAASIKTRADEIAAAPVIDPAVRTELATTIEGFITGPYADLQTEYVALRERAMAVGEALRTLDSVIDAVSLPGAVMERLQSIDETLVQIDTTVTSLAELATTRLSEPGMAAQVAGHAATAEQILATVDQLVADVNARMQDSQAQLATSDDRISSLLTVGAGVATIFGLYLAGLNFLLFQKGRAWSARSPASAT
jgi:hypothetical protein